MAAPLCRWERRPLTVQQSLDCCAQQRRAATSAWLHCARFSNVSATMQQPCPDVPTALSQVAVRIFYQKIRQDHLLQEVRGRYSFVSSTAFLLIMRQTRGSIKYPHSDGCCPPCFPEQFFIGKIRCLKR